MSPTRVRTPEQKARRRLNQAKETEYQRKWTAANRERVAEWRRNHYAANRDHYAAKGRRLKYNLSDEQFAEMLASQDNACAICKLGFQSGAKRTAPHVDHNHADGVVRGLLCNNCNTLIGLANDDPEHLAAAMAYLSRFLRSGSPA